MVAFVTISNADRQSSLADPTLMITSASVQAVTADFKGFPLPEDSSAFNSALRTGLRQLIAANPDIVTDIVRNFIELSA